MQIDLFCKVIDNFGDAGVCWRLARTLVAEQGAALRLWIDDAASLHRLWPEIDARLDTQICAGVEIRHWTQPFPAIAPRELVIEAFGCQLPESFVVAMAARVPPPVWVNLEYLSAEAWVEGCHGLPSPHPRLPLTKFFHFPGFTRRTGGLLRESELASRRADFLARSGAREAFLQGLGVPHWNPGTIVVSLFCYDNLQLAALAAEWAHGERDVLCLVPEGSREGILEALGVGAGTPAAKSRDRLCVCRIPFLDQDAYDRLLWSCDVNFVRGEDSFVRAQWAVAPFVWQPYPQDEGVHLIKLRAFLDRYLAGANADTSANASAAARSMFEAWNGNGDIVRAWRRFVEVLPEIRAHAAEWDREFGETVSLAANLASFCRSKLK